MYATVAVLLDSFVYVHLHCQQPEKDKQNVNLVPPWKNFCGRPWVAWLAFFNAKFQKCQISEIWPI